ncbi:MAG: hypothetical protein HY561_04440 [Gemmatimonadetes bacterium]|nr:hypothetical protein [Gemmatimonadota bacterium]
MRFRMLLGAALALLIPACAYFNSLYNAKRQFAAAERAAARGERGAAHQAYQQTIDKAAKSLRKDPDGRWADDALYLIARARFGRGEYAEARGALLRLLEQTRDRDLRAGGQVYLGAAEVRLGQHARALAPLDSALQRLGESGQLVSFARLWRARARYALGQDDTAAADLRAAALDPGSIGREARLEWAGRAVGGAEPEAARAAFTALFADDGLGASADSVRGLASRAAVRWGAAEARTLLQPAATSSWSAGPRERLRLFAAELTARAGDTAAALEEANAVAARLTGPVADEARVLIARWELARAADVAEATRVRDLLLPALTHPEARTILQNVKVLAVLLERARAGQPLALFTAAELARDELGALELARQLFLTYADVAAQTTWAPKALLAALALQPAGESADAARARLAAAPENVYVAALAGGASAQFAEAEQRLGRALAALREAANAEAQRRDVVVVRAVAVLDSVRAAAKADSTRLACGLFVDSLALKGVRADSARVACVRADTLRLAAILKDTTMFRDTTARRDQPARRRDRAGGDTVP